MLPSQRAVTSKFAATGTQVNACRLIVNVPRREIAEMTHAQITEMTRNIIRIVINLDLHDGLG